MRATGSLKRSNRYDKHNRNKTERSHAIIRWSKGELFKKILVKSDLLLIGEIGNCLQKLSFLI